MKMASSSSSSSSSSSTCSKYDVFLSFSGEMRKGLTDHLYYALKDCGFNVYLEENELTRGENITEALKQAINGSRFAAIIFSKQYAESRLCLDELVEILNCRKTMGQMVLPIFYNINPSDVRHQTGALEEVFRRHQEHFSTKQVQTWRNTLAEIAELAGVDFGGTRGHEGKFVVNIVGKIARKLKKTYLTVAPYPVGIDSRVQKIDKYLDVGGSDDVRIIGIWGMVGLGKTTVAKAIFNKHLDMFRGASFLANVREETLVDSQNTLLFDVLRSRSIRVSNVDAGTEEIKGRLGKLKVLVIVDDVDDMKQLDALAIKFDSFGAGSRIIITTRDKHLLEIQNVEPIHLPAMNNDEALELLSWRAFGKNYPNKEYHVILRYVVDYCEGLPLALVVFGNYISEVFGNYISEGSILMIELEMLSEKLEILSGELEILSGELEIFKSEWESLTSKPRKQIYETLRISFDELPDDHVKALFLDISCFFTGMNKDYVMKILDGSNLHPEIGIIILQEKCLVTVDADLNLRMHGLLRDMGREIVHEQSPNEPGKRSRLWHYRDVMDVLRKGSGTEEIQGLALDLSQRHKPCYRTVAFRNMHELRLLKLKGAQFIGHCKHLSKQLSWLCWPEFPMEVIPRDFNQENLVDIDLSHSNIQVWEDSDVTLEKLKFINLGYCNSLIRLPDFSKIPNLEKLILEECRNLKVIPALPTNLEILLADECIALETMPDFSEMLRMRELRLNHSPKLSEILGLVKALNSMTRIHMEGCTNLTATFKEAILQGWSASGNGGLFLPGNEIPSWFTHVDPQGEIVVPQSFGCDLKALTVCIIYSSDNSQSGGSLCIRVANYTQKTVFLISPMCATVITSHENYLWLGHFSNNMLNVKGGDKINVGAHFVGPGTTDDIHLRVKKIGINLEKEKLINEYVLDHQFMPYSREGKEDSSHKAGQSQENQSCKRLRYDPIAERNAEEETDEIMQ